MLILPKYQENIRIIYMNFLHILALAAGLLVARPTFSQEPKLKSEKQVATMHYYTFQGTTSAEQLDLLQQELGRLEFVTEVKIEYKAEKGAGQVRLITRERAVAGEGDKQFSAVDIKRTFIRQGLSPVEYHSEQISNTY